MNETECCVHLSELMNIQKKIIEKHLDEHKWYNHITNKNEAIIDFIQKYGFIMRETYCESCKEKECKVKAQILKEKK